MRDYDLISDDQKFRGRYAIDNALLLILATEDGLQMVGTVQMQDRDHFVFKLLGNNQLQSPEQLSHGQLFVGGCRYSVEENLFQLFINGELTIERRTAGKIAADSSRVIGAHRWRSQDFYRGAIAEIVVYDRLLSEGEYQQAMAALMGKYQIQPEPTEMDPTQN